MPQGQEKKERKRPLEKSDFEAVLKAATKPLKKEQGEKESAETLASRRSYDSTIIYYAGQMAI